MVFGHDLVQNVQILAEMVDDVEIVLFHTPALHNIPELDEVQVLRSLGKEHGLTYSVHLPTALDPASPVSGHRTDSLFLARKIILRMMELDPQYFILHLPLTPPTLVFQPGTYYAQKSAFPDDPWTSHAFEFLREIGPLIGDPEKLLVENINYAGVLTLEVFSPEDLAESMLLVLEKFQPVGLALEADTD